MTAAYRMRGLGWFLAVVVVALGLYLVSLQVATERKKLEDVNARIASTLRSIRGLETEFDTRANLAQLERWNGTVLALAAPNADQFLPDETRLAQIDFRPGTERLAARNAAYVVPALPVDADRRLTPRRDDPAPGTPSATRPIERAAPPAPVALAAATVPGKPMPVAMTHVSPRPATTIAAVATVPIGKPQKARTIAALDKRVIADNTLGELLSRAQISVGSAR